MNRAIFLDRDGIINVDKSYVHKIEDFEFCEGIFEALKHFQNLGYVLIVVTNQSGIGRGYYSEEEFLKLNSEMLDMITRKGINIIKVYHCPHIPEDNCKCRKPNTLMFESAQKEFDIDMQNSWMIGDKPSDIKAGKNAGIKNTILVDTLTCRDAKYNVKTILDIINIIKN